MRESTIISTMPTTEVDRLAVDVVAGVAGNQVLAWPPPSVITEQTPSPITASVSSGSQRHARAARRLAGRAASSPGRA